HPSLRPAPSRRSSRKSNVFDWKITRMKSFLYALLALVIGTPFISATEPIICQGEASGHLQGFGSDGSFIYWSMFTNLVKTDFTGRVVAERAVDPHHGDCCVHDGKVYVATQNRTKERRGVFIN